ncbi:hypothetical protein TH47_06040 [Thalassospira sp. MCCC 1A02803]|nr:hypothetical protein TH47_06040 [Thalassospira sp. MCCC 1A02803]
MKPKWAAHQMLLVLAFGMHDKTNLQDNLT